MSNLTIRERNTLHGFDDDGQAQELYLRGCQKDELKAFRMADQWHKHLGPFLKVAIPAGANGFSEEKRQSLIQDVMSYMLDRHFYSFFPNQ